MSERQLQVPQRMQASGLQELQKMLVTSSWTFSDQMQNQNRGSLVHNKPQQLSLLFEIRRLSWHVLGELSQKCIVAMKRTSFSPESIGTSEPSPGKMVRLDFSSISLGSASILIG